MSEISANFVVEQLQSRLEVTQNEITFTPEPIQLRLFTGTNRIGGQPSGSNTQVQFNDAGNLGASAAFTFNKTSNVLTVSGNIVGTQFSGNGSGLSSIIGANVTGNVPNATFATSAGSATTAATVTTASQPNITSVGTLTSLVYANTTGINGIYIQGGSNAGAHVSSFVNNVSSDSGINFTIYGNTYTSGSYFNVGANGIAITGNTTSQMAFGTTTANATILGANNNPILKLHANRQAEVLTPASGVTAMKVNCGDNEVGVHIVGTNPYFYLSPGVSGRNWALQAVNGTTGFRIYDSTRGAQTLAVDNNGAVSIAAPASGNALTVTGNVHANGFSSPTAASAATDTTITYKLPIVLNGTTYWIALTTNQ